MKVVYRGIEMEGSPKEVFLLLSLVGTTSPNRSDQSQPLEQLGWQGRDKWVKAYPSMAYDKYEERGLRLTPAVFEAQV